MKNEYYPLWYQLNKKDRYLIFKTSDDSEDEFIIDTKNTKIPTFSKLKFLYKYAKKIHINIVMDSEPIMHDLDLALKWTNEGTKKDLDPQVILSAWNMFIDVANTFKIKNNELQAYRSKAPKAYKVYTKVLIANNLPALTKDNPPYMPIWGKKEIKLIKRVLSFGFKAFKKSKIKIK